MTVFYALVDAMTGREADVEKGLKADLRIRNSVRVKEGNFDFLIQFDAPKFDLVDEFLQTHVRRIPGIAGVEIVVDWSNHSQLVRDAAAKLG